MSDITFGTDGWRAVIGDQFTFQNVRRVTDAIAVAVHGFHAPEGIDRNRLVVSYDRRFLSREFAVEVAKGLAEAGYAIELSNAPTPSQTSSFGAFHRKALGAVMVTASHNPAAYNGIKFKGWYGGSALPEMYSAIARSLGKKRVRSGGSVEEVDLLSPYVEALRANVDVEKLRASGIKLLHDPIHGSSSGLPQRVIGEDRVTTIRGEINPAFGGVNPEPIPSNIGAAFAAMNGAGGYPPFALAICNDGDADRVGIVDDEGSFVSPHKIIALLALYLGREKKLGGEIVKTFSTTRLVEKIAASLGAPLSETAIGFKYVADIMLLRPVLIGGEESGGIAFGSFIPERDGILSGLLVAEAVAHYGKPLSRIVGEMEDEFGALHYDRKDLHREQPRIDSLIARAREGSLDDRFGAGFSHREEKDGVKLNYDDGTWILFRKSGTEPIVRIYCESPDRARVQEMLDAAVRELE